MPLSRVRSSILIRLTTRCTVGTMTFVVLFSTNEPARSLDDFSTTKSPQVFSRNRVGETKRSLSACTRSAASGLSLSDILSGINTRCDARFWRLFLVRFVHKYRQYGFPSSEYSHLYMAAVPTLGVMPRRFILPAISSGDRSFFNCWMMNRPSFGCASIFMPGRLLWDRFSSASFCARVALYRHVFRSYRLSSLDIVPLSTSSTSAMSLWSCPCPYRAWIRSRSCSVKCLNSLRFFIPPYVTAVAFQKRIFSSAL